MINFVVTIEDILWIASMSFGVILLLILCIGGAGR